jgi:hypothetical protein
MNRLQQAIEEHKTRTREIEELEKVLSYKRQVHTTRTRQDFGIADGDTMQVITIVQTIARISEMNRAPKLEVV